MYFIKNPPLFVSFGLHSTTVYQHIETGTRLDIFQYIASWGVFENSYLADKYTEKMPKIG
jgi:hypothetical protein